MFDFRGNGLRRDVYKRQAHAFEECLEALANVLEGTTRDEIDQEGDQDRNHNGGHQTEFDAVVDHRREDDQQEQGQNRKDGVVSGTGIGKGIQMCIRDRHPEVQQGSGRFQTPVLRH